MTPPNLFRPLSVHRACCRGPHPTAVGEGRPRDTKAWPTSIRARPLAIRRAPAPWTPGRTSSFAQIRAEGHRRSAVLAPTHNEMACSGLRLNTQDAVSTFTRHRQYSAGAAPGPSNAKGSGRKMTARSPIRAAPLPAVIPRGHIRCPPQIGLKTSVSVVLVEGRAGVPWRRGDAAYGPGPGAEVGRVEPRSSCARHPRIVGSAHCGFPARC